MQESLISVVVPVYNAEKYLNRCIESILKQTHQNLELILVNDGSTDSSGSICEEYAKADGRVIYIAKENGGVSSARNLGIEKAAGEYVTFVDSDDRIEQDALETLYKSAIENNADFVLPRTRYVMHDAEGNFIENDYDDDAFSLMITRQDYSRSFVKIFNRAFSSTCGRLFSTEVLRREKLAFSEKVKVLEDLIFNIEFIGKCKKIGKIDYVAYNFEVYDIGAYSSKRKYGAVAFGAKSYYYAITDFLENNQIPTDEKYFNLALEYWQIAIRNMLAENGVSIKTIKTLKDYSNEISKEQLYNKCSINNVDTDFKMLFKNGNVLQFLTVHYLKKLKAKLRKIKQR